MGDKANGGVGLPDYADIMVLVQELQLACSITCITLSFAGHIKYSTGIIVVGAAGSLYIILPRNNPSAP